MASHQSKPTQGDKPPHSYPWYSPRFWHGMRFGDMVALFAQHRFRVHPLRIAMALIMVPITMVVSVLSWIQAWRYGKTIAETPLTHPPVFILGHWRSGTTFLHECLVRDDRFAWPTTYACFAPRHFLVSQWAVPNLFWFLMPRKRPMDNMPAGFLHPQEDEFALVAMGAPTPYLRMAFPNDPPVDEDLYDMRDVPPAKEAAFRDALHYFLKALTVSDGRQLLLKSPPHTGRIAWLADEFPGSKFIFIARDPYALFSSTRKLWTSLDNAQGFQIPRHEDLDEYILSTFERMWSSYRDRRGELKPGQLVEIRYEDLVADPLASLRETYERLDLGDFARLEPKLKSYLESVRRYEAGRHRVRPEIAEAIERRWADYINEFGYQSAATEDHQSTGAAA